MPSPTRPSTPWRLFWSLYSQLGGEFLADQGTKVIIDDAKAMQVLTFMQSLSKKGLIPRTADYQGAIAAVRQPGRRLLLPGRVGDHDVPDGEDAVLA